MIQHVMVVRYCVGRSLGVSSLASRPGARPQVLEDECPGSPSMLELKFHVREFQGKIPVSLEQMTSGVCPASLSAPVLSCCRRGLWDVFHPWPRQELSEGSVLGCRVQLLSGSPREKNKSGMEAGEAQSLRLSQAFSPDLIPQKDEADEGSPCL